MTKTKAAPIKEIWNGEKWVRPKTKRAKKPTTFFNSLKARLGDPTVGRNIPLGAYALSIMGVLMVALVWPLVMGGTIALAVALSGEDPHTNSPDDANGVLWFEAGRPAGLTGSCEPITATTNTLVVTSATAGQFSGLRPGVNYTSVFSPGTGSTNTCGFAGNADDVWTVQIPGQVLNPGSEDAISRLSFEAVGSSGCSNWNQCDDGIAFDSWALMINGTTVVERTGAAATSRSCSRAGTGGAGFCTATVDFNVTLSGLESADIGDEMTACGLTCNTTLTFTNAEIICDASPCYQPLAFSTNHRVSVEVFSTNVDTAAFTMRASAWLLAGATLAMTVGATPIWDPLRRFVGDLSVPNIQGGKP
jgi:hypothetical protein